MKRLLFAAVLAAAASAVLAADMAVSVSVGQPGFYGRLDIGGYPQPQLLYQQPIIIEHVPAYRQPIYLNVPPGHAKNWRKHCGAYNACGERVFFVQNSWYQREYVPQYRERHDYRREDYRNEYRGEGDYSRHQGGEDRYEDPGKQKNHGQGNQGNQGKGNQGRGH